MPLKWDEDINRASASAGARFHDTGSDEPLARLTLWPNRSLPRIGFVWFIGGTSALFLLPLLALIGTPLLWVLLPFLIAAIALTWLLLERSYRDGKMYEVLTLWADRVELIQHNPRGPDKTWEANPHWIRAKLHKTGPVKHYLTLTGNQRTVELGAFLSPEERKALYADLCHRLSKVT